MPVAFFLSFIHASVLVQALIPAAVLGTINWLYWRNKGYKSFETFFLSYCAFYALSVIILKMFQ